MRKKLAVLACSAAAVGMFLGMPEISLAAGKGEPPRVSASRQGPGGPQNNKPGGAPNNNRPGAPGGAPNNRPGGGPNNNRPGGPGGAPAPSHGHQAPPRDDHHHHSSSDTLKAGGAGLLLGLLIGTVANSGD